MIIRMLVFLGVFVSLSAFAETKEKCLGGIDGAKCFQINEIIPNYQYCILQSFEALKVTQFKVDKSDEEISMMPGSGIVSVYNWKEQKQYVYTENGVRMEISKDGQCKTDRGSSRLLNSVMRDFAEGAVEAAKPKYFCKRPEGCEEDKPMNTIKDACRDFLKARRVPDDDAKPKSLDGGSGQEM